MLLLHTIINDVIDPLVLSHMTPLLSSYFVSVRVLYNTGTGPGPRAGPSGCLGMMESLTTYKREGGAGETKLGGSMCRCVRACANTHVLTPGDAFDLKEGASGVTPAPAFFVTNAVDEAWLVHYRLFFA